MYILARVDRFVLLNTLLIFAYIAVLVWVNNYYIFSLYDYMGAGKRAVDLGSCVYLPLLAFIWALLCGSETRRTVDRLVTLLIVLLVAHALVLNGSSRFFPDAKIWSDVTLAVMLGIIVFSSVKKIRFYSSEKSQRWNYGRSAICFLKLIDLTIIAFNLFKRARCFSLNFTRRYLRHALARGTLPFGVLNSLFPSRIHASVLVLCSSGVYGWQWLCIVKGSEKI